MCGARCWRWAWERHGGRSTALARGLTATCSMLVGGALHGNTCILSHLGILRFSLYRPLSGPLSSFETLQAELRAPSGSGIARGVPQDLIVLNTREVSFTRTTKAEM